jgi:hypothetical protein
MVLIKTFICFFFLIWWWCCSCPCLLLLYNTKKEKKTTTITSYRYFLRYNTTGEKKGDDNKLELHHRKEGLEFGRKNQLSLNVFTLGPKVKAILVLLKAQILMLYIPVWSMPLAQV